MVESSVSEEEFTILDLEDLSLNEKNDKHLSKTM